MKKALLLLALAAGVTACNESGTTAEIKTDSLGHKIEAGLDSLGENAREGWDSTKAKVKDVAEKVENRIDSSRLIRKDSAQ